MSWQLRAFQKKRAKYYVKIVYQCKHVREPLHTDKEERNSILEEGSSWYWWRVTSYVRLRSLEEIKTWNKLPQDSIHPQTLSASKIL